MNLEKTPFIAAVASISLLPFTSQAELLVYEPFDYGDAWLDGLGGALGTTGVWESNDTGNGNGWRVHPEGLSGVAVAAFTPPTTNLNSFDGIVNNLPTMGGYAGMAGPEDRGLEYGTDGGTGNLDAFIALDPTVTGTFLTGTTTWFCYVGGHAWDRNQGSPMLVFCSDPMQNGRRGDTMTNSGSGIGSTGGPARFNLFDVYPLYYRDGKKQHSPSSAGDGVDIIFTPNTSPQAQNLPATHVMAWQQTNDFHGTFGAPNIIIGKIEWDADTGGEDVISSAVFRETEELTEAAFDAKIAAQPPLSSRNWASNKPNLDQSTFDTLHITSLKFFVDEIRIGTTFASAIGGEDAVPFEFDLNIIKNSPTSPFLLSWPTRDGRAYNLRSSADLIGDFSTWTLVEANIDPSGTGTNTREIDPAEATLFYRVEEVLAPAP